MTRPWRASERWAWSWARLPGSLGSLLLRQVPTSSRLRLRSGNLWSSLLLGKGEGSRLSSMCRELQTEESLARQAVQLLREPPAEASQDEAPDHAMLATLGVLGRRLSGGTLSYVESLCEDPESLSRSPGEARWLPRRDDSPFMSQFPPEEMMGTSRGELPTFRLPDRDPNCRKEDFQLGKVCILFPGLVVAGPHRLSGPRGEFLESAATVAPSRDEVLCEGRPGAPGLLGSAWLSLGTPAEPHPTVQGVTPCGEVGPSVALAVKSWLCLRIRTVIRCWTREVPAKKTEKSLAVNVSRPGRGHCSWDPGCLALLSAQHRAALRERTQPELSISHAGGKDGHYTPKIQAQTEGFCPFLGQTDMGPGAQRRPLRPAGRWKKQTHHH